MNNKIEAALGENQYGFRKGLGTRDAIGSLRFLAERMIELGRPLYVCYIDYEKAFDRVPWQKLFSLLKQLKIEDKIISLIESRGSCFD